MHIAVVGLSHRTAPVEVREKLSIPEETVEKSFNNLKKIDQILEVSILSTCNRLEIYSAPNSRRLTSSQTDALPISINFKPITSTQY